MSDQNININNDVVVTEGEIALAMTTAANLPWESLTQLERALYLSAVEEARVLNRRIDTLQARFDGLTADHRGDMHSYSEAMNLVHEVLLSLTEDDPELLDDERIKTLVSKYGLPCFDVKITVEFTVKGKVTVTAPRGTDKEDVAESVAAAMQEAIENFESDFYDDTDVVVSSFDMDDWRF